MGNAMKWYRKLPFPVFSVLLSLAVGLVLWLSNVTNESAAIPPTVTDTRSPASNAGRRHCDSSGSTLTILLRSRNQAA